MSSTIFCTLQIVLHFGEEGRPGVKAGVNADEGSNAAAGQRAETPMVVAQEHLLLLIVMQELEWMVS